MTQFQQLDVEAQFAQEANTSSHSKRSILLGLALSLGVLVGMVAFSGSDTPSTHAQTTALYPKYVPTGVPPPPPGPCKDGETRSLRPYEGRSYKYKCCDGAFIESYHICGVYKPPATKTRTRAKGKRTTTELTAADADATQLYGSICNTVSTSACFFNNCYDGSKKKDQARECACCPRDVPPEQSIPRSLISNCEIFEGGPCKFHPNKSGLKDSVTTGVYPGGALPGQRGRRRRSYPRL